MYLINLENVCKKYGLYNTEVTALNNVNMNILKGEFISVTGPSGSGKSTLMNILGFLDTPNSGKYFFDGKLQADLSNKRLSAIRGKKIGFIFQGFNLIDELTALQNVELPLIYNGISKPERMAICRNALTMVGLEDRLNHKPSQLSGGQKQRVAIARAVSMSPPLLLADEPTGNLDEKSTNEIMYILKRLNRNGTTIIMITHNNNLAAAADRRLIIEKGEVKSS